MHQKCGDDYHEITSIQQQIWYCSVFEGNLGQEQLEQPEELWYPAAVKV